MKKEELLEIGLTEEQAAKVFALNGADVEREKAKTTQAKADLADAQKQLAERDKDLDQLKSTAGDAEANKKQLEELQAKYTADTERLTAQIAERDYADAITRAISEKIPNGFNGGEFAYRGFIAALREKNLELKDGQLVGIDDFIKAQREANPDAFASDKKPPMFIMGGNGGGHSSPSGCKTQAELMAEAIGKSSAESGKTANSIISMYTGGKT